MATIDERFQAFHQEHPEVLAHLEALARDWFRTRNRLGVGMLFEVLRWQTGIGSTDQLYRLNNDFRSRYVRLMVERHPEWAHRFQTRELRAA
ncbi:hypothetical protein [Micromonospora avicenniae]|uniref:hypothetical protein n=1 Tax=Micromonospora avicenniae TaxID=1198245 RepID=UPI00331A861E